MNLDDLWPFQLKRGKAKNPSEGACLMDAVSWFEYGCLGDHPACVSPVLSLIGQAANDWADDKERQELRKFIPLLPGTVNTAADEYRADYLQYAWDRLSERWRDAMRRADIAGNLFLSYEQRPLRDCDTPYKRTQTVIGAASNAWRIGWQEQRYTIPALPSLYGLMTASPVITQDFATVEMKVVNLRDDITNFARGALEVCSAIGPKPVGWNFSVVPQAVDEFRRAKETSAA